MALVSDVYVYNLGGDQLVKIAEYEKKVYPGKMDIFTAVKNVLPATGECALLYISASSNDKTVNIIYKHNGEESCKKFLITETGSIGYRLFLYAICYAPAQTVLGSLYDTDYIYSFSQMLADEIKPGDFTTYPQYVDKLSPADLLDGIDLTLYRFGFITENRSNSYSTCIKALVRCMANPCTEEDSNNYNETFPILRAGKKVCFLSNVPFHANILVPHHDSNLLRIIKENELTFSKAVYPISYEMFNHEVTYKNPV